MTRFTVHQRLGRRGVFTLLGGRKVHAVDAIAIDGDEPVLPPLGFDLLAATAGTAARARNTAAIVIADFR
jgi:hypothetical protein